MNRSPVQTSSTARHETSGLLVWQLFVALANAAFPYAVVLAVPLSLPPRTR